MRKIKNYEKEGIINKMTSMQLKTILPWVFVFITLGVIFTFIFMDSDEKIKNSTCEELTERIQVRGDNKPAKGEDLVLSTWIEKECWKSDF